MSILLAQGTVLVDDAPVTLYVSSSAYTDPITGQVYDPRIDENSSVRFAVEARPFWFGGRPTNSYGKLTLVNNDAVYDHLATSSVRMQLWRLRSIAHVETAFQDARVVFDAYAQQLSFSDETTMQLTFQNGQALLQRPVQPYSFLEAGATPPFFEVPPNEGIQGQRIPYVIGRPTHVPLLLWDDLPASGVDYVISSNQEKFLSASSETDEMREGFFTIAKGVGAGQYQDLELAAAVVPIYGVKLNDAPTLPLGAYAEGQRFDTYGFEVSRFSSFSTQTVGGAPREVATGFNYNNDATTRYCERWASDNAMRVFISASTTAGLELEPAPNDFPVPGSGVKSMVCRLYVRSASGSTNGKGAFRVNIYNGAILAGSTGTVQFDALVTSQTVDIAFNTLSGFTHRVEFFRYSSPFSADFIIDRIEMLITTAQGNTLPQLVPRLCVENGIPPADADPGEWLPMTGPLAADQIDYDSLQQAFDDGGTSVMDYYFADETSQEKILDLFCAQNSVVYYWSKENKLTFRYIGVPGEMLADAVLDDTVILEQVTVAQEPAVGLTKSFTYDQRYRTLTEAEVANGVTKQDRDYIMRRTDRKVIDATGVDPHYELVVASSRDQEVQTNQAGLPKYSAVEGALAVHATVQNLRTVTVAGTLSNYSDIDIGSAVALRWARYQAVDQITPIVLGYDVDHKAERTRLLLWG